MTEFIPLVTTEAGSCLTSENWKDARCTILSYHMESLLLRPGLSVLKQYKTLKGYLAFDGAIVLDASPIKFNREGLFTLKSPFDGRVEKISAQELVAIVLDLKPDMVLLPHKIQRFYKDWSVSWDPKIKAFISVEDVCSIEDTTIHGIYYLYNESLSYPDFLNQFKKKAAVETYVVGNLNWSLMISLKNMGVEFIQSNMPAKQAQDGIIYSHHGLLNIANTEQRMNFYQLDKDCACPACSSQLTRAYFHHVYSNTPLLCQRFLIQHNVFSLQHYFHLP